MSTTSEDALIESLEADPRRLAVFVGGSAAAEAARGLRTTRPVIVLEGPEVARAAPLLCEPAEPRQLVVVPCDRASAPRMPRIARTSLRNVIVVRFDDEPAGTVPFGEVPEWEPGPDSFAAKVAARFAAGEEALAAGDLAAALEHTEAALVGVQRCADVRGQVLLLHKVAQIHRLRGDAVRAEGALLDALCLEVAIDHPRGESYCHWPLADLALARGDAAAAVSHLEQALAVHEAERLPTVDKLRAALAAARGRVGAPPEPIAPTAPVEPPIESTPLVTIRPR